MISRNIVLLLLGLVFVSTVSAENTNVIPAGAYQSTCSDCKVNSRGYLSCSCEDDEGDDIESVLQNSQACDQCVTNEDGLLTCKLPKGASSYNYKNYCTECALVFGTLKCQDCDGNGISKLTDACSCAKVAYSTSSEKLYCDEAIKTDAPSSPSTPTTDAPTPGLAPECASYWASLDGEFAPYKSCEGGEFQNSQGCQYQNYCCWQATGGSSGVCVTPKNVPVDCVTLNENNCDDHPDYCQWTTYGGGLCQRKCPGDPTVECKF